MSVKYRKNKTGEILKKIENVVDMEKAQNYVPIYDRFFKLNGTNWNHINLKTAWAVADVISPNQIEVVAEDGQKKTIDAFFKYSPLLDPNRYLAGGYEDRDISLPSFGTGGAEKIKDVNNASYVDSFFYYVTAQMKHDHKFVHGIDFFGSFLGIKRKFEYALEDEYLLYTTFFQKNNGKLFTCEDGVPTQDGSNKFRPPLEFGEGDAPLDVESVTVSDVASSSPDVEVVEVSLSETDLTNEVFEFDGQDQEVVDLDIRVASKSSPPAGPDANLEEVNLEEINVEEVNTEELDDRDTVSEESDEWQDSIETSSEDAGSDAPSDAASDDTYFNVKKIKFDRFPVQAIVMERCEETFDSLLDKITPEQLTSALFQIILMLEAYQRAFDFTHNDLHTNNVMYVSTEQEFLFYKVNGKHYKVPTFGKLYKIIDFGRSIYSYKGMQFMSDSFHPNGDAATQYNTGVYYDAKKPRIDPNPSFDLCRLACSMVDVLPQTDDFKDINALLQEWCSDDKGRDVVYKPNGEERYPNFRLYKMIARTVHKHVPSAQFGRPMFHAYSVKGATKGSAVMDLDALQSSKI
jgi:hypothetical protein